MIVPTSHPTVRDLRLVALPLKSAALDFSFEPPPVLGQHTEEVLRELGYTAERIAALRNEGLVE
jgi:crotonobetainyl-CoA:carnitine CoA-transferase CaiB-like acyl-CoA transferase